MLISVIIRFLNMLFSLLEISILIECISSWIAPGSRNQFIYIVRSFTHPILEPFRSLQNKLLPGLPLDFSPIIALFVMDIVKNFILGILI